MRAFIFGISLFLLPGSFPRLPGADKKALPDFSSGLPGMELVRKAKGESSDVFFFSTVLNDREARGNVTRFIGDGWRNRKLRVEEMRLAADRGRKFSGSVSLIVYENPAFPENAIRVMYLNPKGPPGIPDEASKKVVEISVIQLEAEKAPAD